MKNMPRTIQFRFTVGFLLCVVSLIVVVIAAIQVQLRNKLDESATTLISANSENLIAELNRQTTLINTLAQNIAHFVVEAPRDEALFKQVIASMLNLSPSQDLIAGGGLLA